uniref:Phosphorylated adapter RNA export protein n=1 Tax=Globisporangium ultimum (strain ATCC 200006 / CBS 805.95 / DAOM BR144) TaxID=431595 RepID=K3WWG2_GLOUD
MEALPMLPYDATIQAATAHSQSLVSADHRQQHTHAAPQPHAPHSQHQQQQRRPKNHHNNNQQQQQGKKQRRARNFKQQPRAVDMPRVLSELLNEPKQALLRRVVRIVGPKLAWELLKETMRMQQQGGMEVNAFGSGVPEKFLVEDKLTQEKKPRKRTTGGVYFTLLRDKVSKETYRDIYEIETKKKKEVKKHVRYQKKQKFESELSQLGFDDLNVQMNGASAAPGNEGREASGSSSTAAAVAASIYPFTVPSSSVWASSSIRAVAGGTEPERAQSEMHRSGDDGEHEDGEVDETMTLA